MATGDAGGVSGGNDRGAVLTSLEAFPVRLAAAVTGALGRPLAAGEWGPGEVVRHLIACEIDVHQARLSDLATVDSPTWGWAEPAPWPGEPNLSLDDQPAQSDVGHRLAVGEVVDDLARRPCARRWSPIELVVGGTSDGGLDGRGGAGIAIEPRSAALNVSHVIHRRSLPRRDHRFDAVHGRVRSGHGGDLGRDPGKSSRGIGIDPDVVDGCPDDIA